jgi:hypothetical protein
VALAGLLARMVHHQHPQQATALASAPRPTCHHALVHEHQADGLLALGHLGPQGLHVGILTQRIRAQLGGLQGGGGGGGGDACGRGQSLWVEGALQLAPCTCCRALQRYSATAEQQQQRQHRPHQQAPTLSWYSCMPPCCRVIALRWAMRPRSSWTSCGGQGQGQGQGQGHKISSPD